MYLYIAIVLYFGSICFLPWILWPSRRNTAFFMQLPFYTLAYFGGAYYFLEIEKNKLYASNEGLDLYASLLLVSTCFFVVFYIVGYFHQG